MTASTTKKRDPKPSTGKQLRAGAKSATVPQKTEVGAEPTKNADRAGSTQTNPEHKFLSGLDTSIKARIEVAYQLPNGLLIAGWVFDPQDLVRNFCLIDSANLVASPTMLDSALGAQLYRLSRPDVSDSYAGSNGTSDEHGFIAYVPTESHATPQFALHLKTGTFAVVEHALNRSAQEAATYFRPGISILKGPLQSMAAEIPEVNSFIADHLDIGMPNSFHINKALAADSSSAKPVRVTKPDNATRVSSTLVSKGINVSIDLALQLGKGVLVVGYIWDLKQSVKDWGLGYESGKPGFVSAAAKKPGVFFQRILRPDVAITHGSLRSQDDWCGFVLYVEQSAIAFDALVLRTKSSELIAVPMVVSVDYWDAWNEIELIWAHSGSAIKRLVQTQFPAKHPMQGWLDDFSGSQLTKSGTPLIVVEKGVVVEGAVMLLEGWLAVPTNEITDLELWQGDDYQDLLPGLFKVLRPDIVANLSLSQDARPGYVSVSSVNHERQGSYRLKIKTRTGRVQIVFLRPSPVDLHFLTPTLVSAWDNVADIEAKIIAESRSVDVTARLAHLHAQAFASRQKDLSTYSENLAIGVAAVDRGVPLGEDGLLIFGWNFSLNHKPSAVTVLTPEGDRYPITSLMHPLIRVDVRDSFKTRFPQVTERCGFVAHVRLPTMPGALRMIEYEYGDAGKLFQKIPTERSVNSGVALVKDILQWIPAPERIGPALGLLLNNCIAPAVDGMLARSRALATPSPTVRQFGSAPHKPMASVVVPLYGRYDFMRHQIAHFIDDVDFQNIDLIYVLDDPSIEFETLRTATQVHALFGLPFRVVNIGSNLGFGGANNVGAMYAIAPMLVLLNSDVLPTTPGWVSGLIKELQTLPQAKAVAPLLLFHDGMVQHAGMVNGQSTEIESMLVNHHPGKGLPWAGGDAARNAELLTAACVLVRTEDYRAIDGFDESYIVGDYEDADLCQRLKGDEGQLYLVPQFKLWHLERQSQSVGVGISQRMLITIMNGMRYSKRQAQGKSK